MPRRHFDLRTFKEIRIGEKFRFINSTTHYVKISPRRYKELSVDGEPVSPNIIRVGTIHAKVE